MPERPKAKKAGTKKRPAVKRAVKKRRRETYRPNFASTHAGHGAVAKAVTIITTGASATVAIRSRFMVTSEIGVERTDR